MKLEGSGSDAIYKLLAMGSADGANYLYATDFHNAKVDVFAPWKGPHYRDAAMESVRKFFRAHRREATGERRRDT